MDSLRTHAAKLYSLVPSDVATLGQGLFLSAKGLGRISWVLLTAQPVNRHLRWAVNFLRIAGVLQAAAAYAVYRFDQTRAQNAQDKGERTAILARLKELQREMPIPFKGLAVCGQHLALEGLQAYQRRNEVPPPPPTPEQIRSAQVEERKTVYEAAKQGKQVQPFASSSLCQLVNARLRGDEQPLFCLADLHPRTQPSAEDPVATEIIHGLWVSKEACGDEGAVNIVVQDLSEKSFVKMTHECVRAAEEARTALQEGKKAVLQGEPLCGVTAVVCLYKMYSEQGLTMDQALSTVMQAWPSSRWVIRDLWILSRIPYYLQNEDSLDDWLLAKAHNPGSSLPFNAVNLPCLKDGHSTLTYQLMRFITEPKLKKEIARNLSHICSPANGGSLFLVQWDGISEEQRKLFVEILSVYEPGTDEPFAPDCGLWGWLRLRQKDFQKLQKLMGVTSTRTLIREAREAILTCNMWLANQAKENRTDPIDPRLQVVAEACQRAENSYHQTSKSPLVKDVWGGVARLYQTMTSEYGQLAKLCDLTKQQRLKPAKTE